MMRHWSLSWSGSVLEVIAHQLRIACRFNKVRGEIMQSRRACFLPLVLICLTPAGSHGQLTYQVVPRDGKEALWSLDGGWIMTDGTIGEIGLENITSWDLRFSSPSGQASISSEAGGIYLFKLNNSIDDSVPAPDVPSFQATSDNLILNPKLGELQYLMFATEDPFLDGFRGNASRRDCQFRKRAKCRWIAN